MHDRVAVQHWRFCGTQPHDEHSPTGPSKSRRVENFCNRNMSVRIRPD